MSLLSLSIPPLVPQKLAGNNNNRQRGGTRLLVTVSVLGSAGPLRFLVNEEEHVANVIQTALRSYAREGRLPVLGTDLNNFHLYCANSGLDALSPLEAIGSRGVRNFLLCRKQGAAAATDAPKSKLVHGVKRKWKTWLNRSLSF